MLGLVRPPMVVPEASILPLRDWEGGGVHTSPNSPMAGLFCGEHGWFYVQNVRNLPYVGVITGVLSNVEDTGLSTYLPLRLRLDLAP